MKSLPIKQTPTIDSREVAEMVGKRHDNLLRDIDGYADILDSSDLRTPNYFIKSTYTNSQNKIQPCYLVTKMGCEMVANKMTGQKGVLFTAAYVQKFNNMEQGKRGPVGQPVSNVIREQEAQAKLMNAKTRMARQYHKILNEFGEVLSPIAKQAMLSLEANTLAGKNLLPEPTIESKGYSAEDLGKLIGWSAQKVGKFNTAHDIKTEEYGHWLLSKSQYSNKQVSTFVYNEAGKKKFLELAGDGA